MAKVLWRGFLVQFDIRMATRPVGGYYLNLACRYPSDMSFLKTTLRGYFNNGNNSGNDGTSDLVFSLGWIDRLCSVTYLITNGSLWNDLCFSMFIMVSIGISYYKLVWTKYITHCNVVT